VILKTCVSLFRLQVHSYLCSVWSVYTNICLDACDLMLLLADWFINCKNTHGIHNVKTNEVGIHSLFYPSFHLHKFSPPPLPPDAYTVRICLSVCVYEWTTGELLHGFSWKCTFGHVNKTSLDTPNCGQNWAAVRDTTTDLSARVSCLTRTSISRLYQSDEYVGWKMQREL